MRCHFQSILMALVFVASFHAPDSALNTETASNVAAKMTILVGTQDNIDNLVYPITWNSKDKIEYLTQTNVTHKMPSWLALDPTDNKLLVIYKDSAKHQNPKVGKDGKYMIFVDYPRV